MDNENFTENGFIIDLSNAKNPSEVIGELSNILEMSESKGKNICLKIRDVDLSQSQILSIKALMEVSGSRLAFIDANTEKTISSANDLGIKISVCKNNFETEEIKEEPEQPQVIENEVQDEVEQQEQQTSQEEVQVTEQQIEQVQENETESSEEYIEEESVEVPTDLFTPHERVFGKLYPQEESMSELPYETIKTENIQIETSDEDLPTLYLKQTLRSGQTISYDGNILVIGDTHPGSEIIAKGDVTVWGVLGGIAHAGTNGNKNARIRALKLNAIQLRIAGIYAGRLSTVNIPHIQRTNEFTPQEARIENDQIIIKSINNEV